MSNEHAYDMAGDRRTDTAMPRTGVAGRSIPSTGGGQQPDRARMRSQIQAQMMGRARKARPQAGVQRPAMPVGETVTEGPISESPHPAEATNPHDGSQSVTALPSHATASGPLEPRQVATQGTKPVTTKAAANAAMRRKMASQMKARPASKPVTVARVATAEEPVAGDFRTSPAGADAYGRDQMAHDVRSALSSHSGMTPNEPLPSHPTDYRFSSTVTPDAPTIRHDGRDDYAVRVARPEQERPGHERRQEWAWEQRPARRDQREMATPYQEAEPYQARRPRTAEMAGPWEEQSADEMVAATDFGGEQVFDKSQLALIEQKSEPLSSRIVGNLLTFSMTLSMVLSPFALLYVLKQDLMEAILDAPFYVIAPIASIYVIAMVFLGMRVAAIFGCGPWYALTARPLEMDM